MGIRVTGGYLRGRLARRLLLVFVLAAVVPVLITGFVGYRELVRGTEAARARALRDGAKSSALTFLSELQSARAALGLASPPARGARASWPSPFTAIDFVPIHTPSQWRRALAALPARMRAPLRAGQPMLLWQGASDGRPRLSLLLPRLAEGVLVQGTLDAPRMLDEALPVEPGLGIALTDAAATHQLIRADDDPVPRAIFERLARAPVRGSPDLPWQSPGGQWQGGRWDLFLQGGFAAAPPLRVLICAPAGGALAGIPGLRLTIPMMLLGTLAFAAWLAVTQLRRYLEPLQTLTAATRRLGASHFDVEVSIRTDDELAELGEDFNRMARNLREQHRELQRRAEVDGLTGLSNRDFFRRQLAEHLARGERAALLYVDLDEFKKVNDSAGHAAGDMLLKEMAGRLRGCMQASDTVARLGGDEFAILLAAGAEAAEATAAAARVLHAIQAPISVAGAERRVSGSIGIALIPTDGDTVDLLLRNADIAMYEAKDRGRNRSARFSPEMHRRMARRISLEIALQEAITRGDLRLHYQPIMSAGRLAAVEALVRWARSDGTEVGPAEFIPVAEQSGLIVAIGEWVLERACEDFARWREAGIAPGHVSINVAPRQLESSRFPERLQALMARWRMRPMEIQLEVTEGTIATSEQVVATLEMLHGMGLRLALDDFGTGYSSLSQLQRLPFDVVKVDRSFIVGLPGDGVSLQLVRTILRMTQSLDKVAVAEGVETAAQRDLLRELGCSDMQGYLFGRPMPERQMRRELESRARDLASAQPRSSTAAHG